MRKTIAPEQIAGAILILRGQRVLHDSELAALYGVSTKRFNQQVRRNRKRFPADFMFQLTAEETSSLRSQIATLKTGRGQHRKYLPYAFTEHGAIMAATILNSPRAIEMSVYVVRAFVQLLQAWRAIPILGLLKEHYPWNVPSLEVTPLWEPMLALVAGVVFLLAIVLILRRSRVALGAVVAPFAIMLLLFAVRCSRPESDILQSLSIAYQQSQYALIWPILGLAITILICLALWQDRRTPAPR
jgi:hypothetical protein